MSGLVKVLCRVPPPDYLSFQTAAFLCVFCLLTVPGNLMVLISVWKDPLRKLRSPFNYLLCNLAITDLLVGLIVEPVFITVHFQEGLHVPSHNVVINHMMYFTPSTASVFGITALTFDRYIAVASPMTYLKFKSNSKRPFIASLLIWLLSISISCLYFATGFILYSFTFIHVAIISTLGFYIFVYVSVVMKLKKQAKALGQASSAEQDQSQARMENSKESKITKTFMRLLVAFACCYGPSCIMVYIMFMCTSCSCETIHWFRDWSMLSIVLNSAINPYLYAWSLPHFRESILAILGRRTNIHPINVSTSQTVCEEIQMNSAA